MKFSSTKKALALSVLSLVVCVSLLIGTTFAWFTDSVTSANNVITSGNLKVTFEWAKGTENPDTAAWKDASTNAIFNHDLWEPGYVCARHIKIGNAGSLALKYVVAIEANGTVSDLAKVIDVYYVDPAVQLSDRAKLDANAYLGTLDQVIGNLNTTAFGELEAGDDDTITIALKMQETAGNEYQDMSIGTDFSVTVFATQLASEDDSFGNDYDEDAYLPVVYNIDEFKAALADGKSVKLGADIASEDGFIIDDDKNVTIDLGGKTITVNNGASTNNRSFKVVGNAELTVKNGTLVADGELTSGAYGTIRTEGNAKVTLDNVKLYNYRGNGLNVKATGNSNVTINNSEIYSQYGGGVEAAGGTVELNNVKIEQKGMWTAPYNSMAVSVNGGGKAVINSGTYSTECLTAEEANNQGTSHGPWTVGVLNSGGTLVINGGTFSNDNFGDNGLATAARGLVLADTGAVVEINGGIFNALKNVVDIQNNLGIASKNPSATIKGGTFSADPRISASYSSNLIKIADGHKVETKDGAWTVEREYINVVPAGADKVANGAALADVITATTEASFIKLPAGEYKMPGIDGSKDVTIVGTKDTVIDVTAGAYMDGSKVAFEGVTIKGSTGMANGNGSDYAAMYTPDVTYVNCTFDGAFRIGRDGATFINCTFTNLGNDYVWNMNNDTVFEGCTFNTEGKALLLYADGPSSDGVATVVVKNCKFNATKGAKAGAIANQNCAAIEIQNYGCSIELISEGNTHDSNFSGMWRIKTYDNRGYTVTVNGTEYTSIAVDGKTMTIDADKNVTVNG